MKRIFVSGPMTGLPLYNFAAFDVMKAMLHGYGFDALTPVDINRHFGFDGSRECKPEYHREIIMHDLEALETCDAMIMLDGWETSKGAAVEIAAAAYWGIPVFSGIAELLSAREAA